MPFEDLEDKTPITLFDGKSIIIASVFIVFVVCLGQVLVNYTIWKNVQAEIQRVVDQYAQVEQLKRDLNESKIDCRDRIASARNEMSAQNTATRIDLGAQVEAAQRQSYTSSLDLVGHMGQTDKQLATLQTSLSILFNGGKSRAAKAQKK